MPECEWCGEEDDVLLYVDGEYFCEDCVDEAGDELDMSDVGTGFFG